MAPTADFRTALASHGATVDGDCIVWNLDEVGRIARIPLPPWSTAQDLDETCGTGTAPDPLFDGSVWISWEEAPKRSWDLTIHPCGKTIAAADWTYELQVTEKPLDNVLRHGTLKTPFFSTKASRRIALQADESRSLGIDLHPAGPRPRIIVICVDRVPEVGFALLQFTCLCRAFDAETPATWPIPRPQLIDWARHMGALVIAPQTG